MNSFSNFLKNVLHWIQLGKKCNWMILEQKEILWVIYSVSSYYYFLSAIKSMKNIVQMKDDWI